MDGIFYLDGINTSNFSALVMSCNSSIQYSRDEQ